MHKPFLHQTGDGNKGHLTSQAEVDAFNCSSIDGDLLINGSDITNLGALITLKSITVP